MKLAQLKAGIDRLMVEVGEDPEALRSVLVVAFYAGAHSGGLRYTSAAKVAEAAGLPEGSDLSWPE